MNNLKRYVAPTAETVKVGLMNMCCGSTGDSYTYRSGSNASSKEEVLSKEAAGWSFDDED